MGLMGLTLDPLDPYAGRSNGSDGSRLDPGGWRLVAGGWWLVAGGWWLVAGAAGFWLLILGAGWIFVQRILPQYINTTFCGQLHYFKSVEELSDYQKLEKSFFLR